ncbi:Hypothetical protein SRAE_1000104500 [Strongyloides ratti]|uniref:Uncharacterized protein n=1 Tax=Strongyloides ratti TaxID=34506 RepID=A0A090KZD1_STRRB|nr:Hypothetical protein SRAE_1000104500 [Strongyloides ratti]CEF62776.1 Hypothetical protein SRAE_1000104500 [Strongyloides ratti]
MKWILAFAQVNSHGVRFFHKNENEYKQTITTGRSENEYLTDSKEISCHLSHCEIGLLFYHKTKTGMKFFNDKITDFYQIVYMKYVTNSGKLLFSQITIESNNFPLILCPNKGWVNKFSSSQYIPIEKEGIIFEKLLNRHIFVPIYSKHADTNVFICGEVRYLDGTKLKIGYEIKNKKINELKVESINLLNEKLSCKNDRPENDFYHFSYNSYNSKVSKMKFIDKANIQNSNIYYDSIIYLYDKKNYKIKELEEHAYSFFLEIGHSEYYYPRAKPSCAKFVKPLNASLKVFTTDDEEIKFSESKNNPNIKIFSIDKSLMNIRKEYDCRIEVDNIKENIHLKNFYKNTFIAKLVSIDDFDNEKNVTTLEFKNNFEGYGRYSCILTSLNGEKLHKDAEYIKPLTFETFPIGMMEEIQKITWPSINTVTISCKKKISNFAKLQDMHVIFSETSQYRNSINEEMSMFFDDDDFVKFKHGDYFYKVNKIEDIIYHCKYQTNGNISFTIKTKGIILENEIKNSMYQTILIVVFIVVVTAIFIGIIVGIILLKKAKKAKQLRKKLGLNSEMSKSEFSSTSMSSSMSDLSGLSNSKFTPSKLPLKNISKLNSNISSNSSLSSISKGK